MLSPLSFTALPNWQMADLADAWRMFRTSADAVTMGVSPLRPALAPDGDLVRVCQYAVTQPAIVDHDQARRYFEHYFAPYAVQPDDRSAGFLTGYYEPVLQGSRRRTADFAAPILPRPDDLVTFAADEVHPGVPRNHSAGRLGPGGMASYADRATLEAFAISDAAAPLVWLRDWTEVFLVHVQGSARVRLDDGSEIRLVYAGRNGHPYVSIGRILIDAGEIAEAAMTLDRLKTWLRQGGQEPDQPGRALMQQNRSYIFFRAAPADDAAGPTGGQGVPLTARRSIAVDRTLWPYGLPFWIESQRPVPGFGPGPLARLFVAQDTGSAILGSARADLFLGSGDEAGRDAGDVRHAAFFTVLRPRPS